MTIDDYNKKNHFEKFTDKMTTKLNTTKEMLTEISG